MDALTRLLWTLVIGGLIVGAIVASVIWAMIARLL